MLKGIKSAIDVFYNKYEKRVKLIAFACAIALCCLGILGSAFKSYTVFDGSKSYKVNAFFPDTESILDKANLKSQNYEVLKVKGNNIRIQYLFPVHITMGDKVQTVNVKENSTVKEILTKAGFTPDKYDMVEPSLNTTIKKTAYIDYTDINYVSGKYTEVIPCVTETIYSPEHNTGYQTLKQGNEGLKEITYTAKVVNGKTVEKKINNTVVLTAAVSTKKIVGTKPQAVTTSSSVKYISTLVPKNPIELDKNGNPVKYTKKLKVQATAYTYTGNNCSTGVAPQPGYIAVNPKVIPYGTKMYIKSSDGRYIYGYAVAADTGGFIKKYPTNVDLFFSSHAACSAFGRRNVEIYILE